MPERVDVVVCETLGNYPFEENIIATLNDARARFLKRAASIIPHSVEQFVVPVVGERYWRELGRLGRGRLRPRLRAGQGHDPQQHLCALVRGRRFARGRRRGGGVGRGRLRPPQQDDARGRGQLAHEPARDDLRPGSVVARGAGSWRQLWHRARSIRARIGSSSTCRRSRRSPWRPDRRFGASLRSTTSYERGTNVTWTLDRRRQAAGREVVRQALDLERGYLP